MKQELQQNDRRWLSMHDQLRTPASKSNMQKKIPANPLHRRKHIDRRKERRTWIMLLLPYRNGCRANSDRRCQILRRTREESATGGGVGETWRHNQKRGWCFRGRRKKGRHQKEKQRRLRGSMGGRRIIVLLRYGSCLNTWLLCLGDVATLTIS